jgi:DNA-binding GntR family transcriptional regulator
MEIVQQQINLGTLEEGQRIPSELEMSDTYKVNRHTVRQAINELCRTRALYKIKGRGTFVARPLLDLIEYRLSSKNRYTENIQQVGKVPVSKILSQDIVSPSFETAAALALSNDDFVYVLDIIRFIDDKPFILSKVYLPVKYLPDLFGYTKEFNSLTAVYENYGVSTQRVKSVFRASFSTIDEAVILDIPSNMPVLRVESVLKTQDNVLIEYNISCYRGDLAKISVGW